MDNNLSTDKQLVSSIRNTEWIDLSAGHKKLREDIEKSVELACVTKEDTSPIMVKGAFGIGKTESLVSRCLGENKIYNRVVSKDSPKEKVFQINSRDIISITLYSPSPRAIAVKGYDTVLEQYKNYLYDF